MADNNTFVLFEEIKNKLETNLQGAKGVERKGERFCFSPRYIYTCAM